MTGSYAGAMGQPQFMPTSYLRYAVDFTARPARHLDQHGRTCWPRSPITWRSPAGTAARPGASRCAAGRLPRRPAATTGARCPLGGAGLRPIAGRWKAAADAPAGAAAAGRAGGDAFLVFANFAAIRRYNPSDFYALVVGLLGDSDRRLTVPKRHTRNDTKETPA